MAYLSIHDFDSALQTAFLPDYDDRSEAISSIRAWVWEYSDFNLKAQRFARLDDLENQFSCIIS